MVAFMLFKHHCLNIKSLTSTEQELYSQSYQDETTFYEMSRCPSHTHYMLSVGFLITRRDKALTSMSVRNILIFQPFHIHLCHV